MKFLRLRLIKCKNSAIIASLERKTGEFMDKKMNVLDVRLDNYTAKDAMKAVTEFLQTELMSTIEIVTVDSLMCVSQTPGLKEDIEALDLVLAGDAAILEAAGVSEKKKLQEAQNRVFLKMFLRYLHKNKMKVFVLGETEEEGQQLRAYIEEELAGIQLAGFAVVPEDESADDQITNVINGTEADCILACMNSPKKEQFIRRVRQVLNVKLWLGMGRGMISVSGMGGWKEKLMEFVERMLMKREAEKIKKRKEA